ncbi:serine protease [Virgibacillus sp. 179-BFC.A HS]|uniref:Serine protease n=1 Tax=Tigheibacillus jepli TaxID=3035914 RepID=A0ABU5CIY4_9BACI|nr:serine protease [Virgibacillus sp. 179-BFC.A HS]MDY0406284.1 serine protease [Virgibacillus sp. 179-BFC.A HS]
MRNKQQHEPKQKPKRPFPKWAFWLIAICMFLQGLALLPKTLSFSIFDFITTSAKLSTNDSIKDYQKAVVAIETEDKIGTGFSINGSGKILTNYHVVEGNEQPTVSYQNKGLFRAKVTEIYPEIDLAVLQVKDTKTSTHFPYLPLATSGETVNPNENVYIIGNPLGFIRIANEGELLGMIKLSGWKESVYLVDAKIYHGNSGSPVINSRGEVMAVVFATMDHEKFGKVGLAIPITLYLQENLADIG